MQKYRDIVLDNSGNAILSASITVTDNDSGSASTIYSDNGVTVKANPFTASGVDGAYEFYAPDGHYNVTVSAAGFTDEQILDISLQSSFVALNKAEAVGKVPVAGEFLFVLGDDGGQFKSVTGAAAGTYSDDGGSYCGTVFIPTGGDGSKAWVRDFNGAAFCEWYGAAGDGTTDDTTALDNTFTNNTRVDISDGKTFLVDDIDIDTVTHVNCYGTIKRRSAVAGGSDTIAFVSGSEGSSWRGGTFNGNRSGLTWASGTWSELAVKADRINVSDVIIDNATHSGMIIDTTIGSNIRNIKTDGCTVGVACARVVDSVITDVYAKSCDNSGDAIDVRGFTISDVTNSTLQNILVDGMTGDTAVPSSTDAITGILMLDVYNCTINNIQVIDSTGDLYHLCISILGAWSTTINGMRSYNFSGTGAELTHCDDTTINNFVIDRVFAENAGSADTNHDGIVLHGSAFYDAQSTSGRDRRALRPGRGLHLSDGVVTRCAVGVRIEQPHATLSNVRSSGNRSHGFLVVQDAVSGSYGANAAIAEPRHVRLLDCIARYNESRGLDARAGSVIVEGGDYSCNGQDTTLAATAKVGIGYNGSDTLHRIKLSGAELADDQADLSQTDGISFEPGTSSTSVIPNNDATAYTVTVVKPLPVGIGQNVKLINATGAGDVTGRVWLINRDEITIILSGSTTFSDTGNTTALTGAWTTDGSDSKQLNGTSGAALTEVPGGYWITDGTEWRQVDAVTGNDTIIINTAFTTPLSSTTVNKLEVNIEGVATQHYGAYLQDANISKVLLGEVFAHGNLTSDIQTNGAGELVASNATHSSAFRTTHQQLADDTAFSFTPSVNSGLIVVTDDTNTGGVVVFRATGSPLTTSVGATASFSVTTGALAGTTGTDTELTVSTHTDGKIYVENRRGTTRDISVLVIAQPE